MNDKWLVPRYYLSFTCKADGFRHTCCSGWRIPVSKKEYERLITMERSPELDRKIQDAFVIPETVDDSCYGLLRMVCIGATHDSDDENDLIDAVSALFHLIDHTAFFYNVSIIADNAPSLLRI